MIAVRPEARDAVLDGLADAGSGAWMIGQVTARRSDGMLVEVAR